MSLRDTNRGHAKRVALAAKSHPKAANPVTTGLWHWINGVASGIQQLFSKTLGGAFRIAGDNVSFDAHVYHDIANAYNRILVWIYKHLILPFIQRFRRELTVVISRQRNDARRLARAMVTMGRAVMAYAADLVRREQAERIRQVRHAEALARQETRHLHMTIEREAASGYAAEQAGRTDTIIRLLEFAGAHNPAVRAMVGDIASGLLDLLTVDDPLLRVALGFVIKHVIDRLGIEKPLGRLIDDLMAPILGDPKPHDLHDVIADISRRLGAVEGQWAQFFADGGSEVEQAGTEWQHITSAVTGIAIVGFTAQAVADPDGWASDIQAVIGTPATDIVSAAARLFRG